MADMRDRLAEIIRNANMAANPLSQFGYAEADALLANGVILPPCRVGDVVWYIRGENIYRVEVVLIRPFATLKGLEFRGNALWTFTDPFWSDGRMATSEVFITFGETAFLTREEAEKALKEKEK